MNSRQIFEKFFALSPVWKISVFLFIFIFLLGIILSVYFIGENVGDFYASKRFMAAEKARMQKISALEAEADGLRAESAAAKENEQKHALENAVLKNQNEIQAEILRANDARLVGDADKLARIFKQRQEKLNEIENLDDFDAGFCALCRDVRASGFATSDQFCGRCNK